MKKSDKFGQGGAYTCRICKKLTRETGRDESGCELCANCMLECELENAQNDWGPDSEDAKQAQARLDEYNTYNKTKKESTMNNPAATPEVTDKVIDKIRKLMNMAEGTADGGEHERDTALKMAMNLLAKYNLSMSSVKGKDKEGRQTVEKEMTSHAWAKIVAKAVAEMLFCKYFSTKIGAHNATRMRMTFIGLESNVITAKEMTEYIIASITKEAARKAKEAGVAGSFQRSFCNGAANQIKLRCNALRAEAEKASAKAPEMSSGTALVLASLYDTEKKANDDYVVTVMNVKLTTKPLKPNSKSGDGYSAGVAHGKTIQLNKQVK